MRYLYLMEEYQSFDPYRQCLMAKFPFEDQLDITRLEGAAKTWRSISPEERALPFLRLADHLHTDRQLLGELISLEMGKPITEALAEIDKCISAIKVMTVMAPPLLKSKPVISEAYSSFLAPEPYGILLGIMPWNFPWWQIMRFALPAMLSGNALVIKPAPNVPKCSRRIEDYFLSAGFPPGLLTVQFFSNEGVAHAIRHPLIAGVSFTGSDATGEIIGALAGKSLKKVVMELGGNDPMIVFADSDLNQALHAAVQSRCINGGQACNGAKRFLVQSSIYDEFLEVLDKAVSSLKCGDPLDPSTQIGPLARFDLLEKVRSQVFRAVNAGARLMTNVKLVEEGNWFFPPVVLADVQPGNPAFEEEIFGPVWSVTPFNDCQDAVRLANGSKFGLGASVWTKDESLMEWIIPQLETGNVFINDFVRSDPRFPFGGVKRSGYGKELGEAGLYEFVNWKTVYRRT